MDVHSPAQRSHNMSQIKGKDTRPEILIRKLLWASGYRYRLHRKDLPGMPDVVLSKYMAVIFVHGCFWHRHGCKATTTPKTNQKFWRDKFDNNIIRDKRNLCLLQEQGWRVMVVWECAVKGKGTNLNNILTRLQHWLNSDSRYLEIPEK